MIHIFTFLGIIFATFYSFNNFKSKYVLVNPEVLTVLYLLPKCSICKFYIKCDYKIFKYFYFLKLII